MKPAEERVTSNTKNLRLGYSENLEQVFLLDDQEDGVMRTFDAEGKFVSERKLTPKEKQLSVVSVNRNAG